MERNELEERAIRGREEADTFAEVGHIVGEICSEINGYLRGAVAFAVPCDDMFSFR